MWHWPFAWHAMKTAGFRRKQEELTLGLLLWRCKASYNPTSPSFGNLVPRASLLPLERERRDPGLSSLAPGKGKKRGPGNEVGVLGVAPGVGYACLKHRRALEKGNKRCSSVLSSSHSKNLMTIPGKLNQFHDKRGKTVESYRPGGKWCNKCQACYYRKIKTNKRVSLLACVHTCFFEGWWICSCNVLPSVGYKT